MNHWRSVWLVARREVLERGRSRGFLIGVAFTTLLVVGSILIPAVLFRDEGVTRLGVVAPAPDRLVGSLEATASQLDRELTIVDYTDAEAADSALTSGAVDAVVEVPADLSSAGQVRFHERNDPTIVQLVTSAVIAMRFADVLEEAGVDPSALAQAQTPPAVANLDPPTGDDSNDALATIGAVLVLIGVFGFGYTVLTGVVEEKQSRVVEVVLSSVHPRDLLMGKVLGIGILGLLQLAMFAIAGGVALAVTQEVTLPTTTPSMLVVVVIWFLLGYALYATALGFLGALASRMEEASNASMPVTIVAMISYFLCLFSINDDPTGFLAQVLTFLPPSAPFAVPARAALGAISVVEIAISIAITVVAIWLLFGVAARIYSGAVLRTSGLTSIREAWRSGA